MDELEDAVFRAPPKEFTAARDALAAALKAEKRNDEAKAVKAWRRPALPVWLWNRLFLDGDEAPRRAVALAGTLAKAISGNQPIGKEAAELKSASGSILARARELASEVGVGFSTGQEHELIDLVQALPWNEDAREKAARGRLLESPPPVDPLEAMRLAVGAAPLPPEPEPPKEDPKEKAAREAAAAAHARAVEAAEAEVARAKELLAAAEERVDEAQRVATEARRAVAVAEAHLRSFVTASPKR